MGGLHAWCGVCAKAFLGLGGAYGLNWASNPHLLIMLPHSADRRNPPNFDSFIDSIPKNAGSVHLDNISLQQGAYCSPARPPSRALYGRQARGSIRQPRALLRRVMQVSTSSLVPHAQGLFQKVRAPTPPASSAIFTLRPALTLNPQGFPRAMFTDHALLGVLRHEMTASDSPPML